MIDAATYSKTGKLRNGRTIEIRAIKPADRADMVQAVHRESPQSLHRRFFAIKREFSKKEEDFFLNVDFVKHVALVAVADENGTPAIIGGGRFVHVKPGEAEVAFTILDDYQGQGLGTLLMRHLVAIALALDFDALVAEVLPENTPMLRVFEKCGHPVKKARHDGNVHVTISLRKQ